VIKTIVKVIYCTVIPREFILLSYFTDVDECVEIFGVCDQICSNVIGSYHCNCTEGFTLETDGHTCKLNEGIVTLYN